MKSLQMSGRAHRSALAFVLLCSGVALAGCGMPGAPQPPSLQLLDRVGDLSAVRTGNQVALTWSMPKRDTDKVVLKGNVTVRICRNESVAAACSAAATLQVAPEARGSFTDTLPPTLAEGAPRVLTYFVELDNRKGRTAGLSNGAQILAGEAPAAVNGLAAEMRRDGVLLQWVPAPPAAPPVAVRLVRKLVSTPAPAPIKSTEGPLAPRPEPLERTLLVEPGPYVDQALDSSILFGETYEYRAQRVARVTVNGETLELAGPLSGPVRIAAVNVFPPAVPRGLAAVATAGAEGAGPAIDLNWQPGTEVDLAGYMVYRSEAGQPESSWQRISPAQPEAAPYYHDASVQPGHTYRYAVSAVDQQGHESEKSAAASEAVPEP
ncbi:MAG TPA: fibronectin type III domain-containing protein [Terracidiphilus sp.]|nr:fibronectin type III domain-containing protein [Terracidiphilus sp.]